MKNLNLNLVTTFYTVVKNNSFSQAADELMLSKSVISKQIRQLENELQCTLIQRTTRTLSLTEHGQYLYERYSKVLDDIKNAHDVIDQRNDTLSGSFKVRIPIVLENDLSLMKKISSFAQVYPKVELEFLYGYTLDNLVADGIDLAFHIGDMPDSSFRCRKIKDIGTRVVASKNYLDKNGKPSVPSDLKQHQCMNYRSCLTKDKWRFNFSDETYEFVDLNSAIRSDSEAMLVEMAKNGVGVACALDFLVNDYIEQKQLENLLTNYTWSTELYVVYPSSVIVSHKVRTFIDHILQ
ncbi:LysR substrate-binding domain-containing protein [Vibrio sp. Isolate31]|uniref:LysR family transcriptional regulator n=1 Tax=unclassified Vibrio TaxID=2614977 RepID=UPI001EFCD3A3|nr:MULTISPECIES: LysR family transcriptional regulator [unclassified Vibrio]MCG9553100.1 LysR substrate-binding domain-containing protein [Vibrio sp. Isolate32]MCG9599573.1 LysR substrate-binding domain-containing protein [Vibrio sp. Isolate31]